MLNDVLILGRRRLFHTNKAPLHELLFWLNLLLLHTTMVEYIVVSWFNHRVVMSLILSRSRGKLNALHVGFHIVAEGNAAKTGHLD